MKKLLKDEFPELFSEINVEKTLKEYLDLDIDNLSYGSGVSLWWTCKKNPAHVWKAEVHLRACNNRGCPYCANMKLLIGDNDLRSKYPELAEEFDEKLNGISANNVLAGSNKKYYWRCSKNPSHVWLASINKRIIGHTGCPVCANRKVISGINDLKTLYPELAKEFAEDINKKSASEVSAGSNTVYYWRCKNHKDHVWKASVNNRVNKHYGCPYCSGKSLKTGFNDLKTKFPNIAKEFASDLNNITPDKVYYGSKTKYYWRCSRNPIHIWKTSVGKRTHSLSGCPYCSNNHSVPELVFYQLCKKYVDKNTENAKKLGNKEFDIYIPNINLFVEYDGLAYHSDSFIMTEDMRLIAKNTEIIKNNLVLRNNSKIIRIRETDNPNNIKKYHEIFDNVEYYYIGNKQNKEYYERLSKIFFDVFDISIGINEIQETFTQIRLSKNLTNYTNMI